MRGRGGEGEERERGEEGEGEERERDEGMRRVRERERRGEDAGTHICNYVQYSCCYGDLWACSEPRDKQAHDLHIPFLGVSMSQLSTAPIPPREHPCSCINTEHDNSDLVRKSCN